MSGDAKIGFAWGDGDQVFRLAIAQLEELQDKADAGPQEVFARLRAGAWRVADVQQTIRLGLVGGGMKAGDALIAMRRYAGEGQLLENVPVAMAILAAALIGAIDDPVGKKPAGERATNPAGSALAPSTATEPQ